MSLQRSTVNQALEQLNAALADAIRAEQLRDRLTGLGNDESLTEWIQTKIDTGGAFWIAFIEVDRFKSINDKYGYDDADQLLKKIAGQLELAAKDFFPDGALPFRAHGDEFFAVGDINSMPADETLIDRALDQIRRNIASIRLPHQDKEPMTCTVSIGWLLWSDLFDTGLTSRAIRGKLELAVAEAKQTRDTTIRYSPKLLSARTVDGRSDCASCATKFTLTVKQDNLRNGDLHCPNCGATVARPPSLITSESIRETARLPTT